MISRPMHWYERIFWRKLWWGFIGLKPYVIKFGKYKIIQYR